MLDVLFPASLAFVFLHVQPTRCQPCLVRRPTSLTFWLLFALADLMGLTAASSSLSLPLLPSRLLNTDGSSSLSSLAGAGLADLLVLIVPSFLRFLAMGGASNASLAAFTTLTLPLPAVLLILTLPESPAKNKSQISP